jgi:hypothetical protein
MPSAADAGYQPDFSDPETLEQFPFAPALRWLLSLDAAWEWVQASTHADELALLFLSHARLVETCLYLDIPEPKRRQYFKARLTAIGDDYKRLLLSCPPEKIHAASLFIAERAWVRANARRDSLINKLPQSSNSAIQDGPAFPADAIRAADVLKLFPDRVKRASLYRWIDQKKLDSWPDGEGDKVVSRAQLEALLDRKGRKSR